MAEDVFCSLEGYMQSLGLDRQPLAGIPAWMAAVGVVAIILFSHLFVKARQTLPTTKRYWRFNLFAIPFLKRWVRLPFFPMLMQSVSLGLFLLILTAGLFGNPKTNIAPVLTWTWWWALLIFLVLGWGQVFCMICPWEALSSLVTSLSWKSRIKKLGFERPWPRGARLIYPAIVLFILLTWFELGNNVTHSPSMTALMALFMMAAAVLIAIVFEKRAFCRYVCLVGRITGLYSLFSPLELRPQSANVCLNCTTKDCHRGNDHATGCPTHLFPGHLRENTYCTLCTECVRACPHDNLTINMRAPATDLLHKDRFQWDEAILAIVLLALTSFHGLTMTPLWTQWNHVLRVETGWGPTVIFTLLMFLMLVAPLLLFWFGAHIAFRLTLPHRPNSYASPNSGVAPPHLLRSGVVATTRYPAFISGKWTRLGIEAVRRFHRFITADRHRLGLAAMIWPAAPEQSSGMKGWPPHLGVVSTAKIFKAFAYSLIPVALFYHLAHNCMHFFLEAGQLLPLLSDPFGWGWNLFGTAGRVYGPLLSLETIWVLQVLLIVIGHVYGVIIADRVAKRLFQQPRQVALALIPLLLTMIFYSCYSIWLIAQPMDMRTAL